MRIRFLFLSLLFAACSTPTTASLQTEDTPVLDGPVDVPVAQVTSEWISAFKAGDRLFDLPLRDSDGLGPLYIRASCGACHEGAVRGPGFVEKMSVVLADGHTAAADQSLLAWGHTARPLTAGGGITPLLPPANQAEIKVSLRVGPPVLGRGYLEAVLDSEIERVASEQAARTDEIHGQVNYVSYPSEPNIDQRFHQYQKGERVIGRFGLKARVATLDDFSADALLGDMGITSPLRPTELPNPDGLSDDKKSGIDVSYESVNGRADYMRLLAIPRRAKPVADAVILFEQAKCAVCHAPALKTRADYPILPLAAIDAAIFSDLLLHDMGDELADGLSGSDGLAQENQWRTAPLIGVRFNQTYMHDGRASSVHDAILAHGGVGSEATSSVKIYEALSESERRLLLEYVLSL